MNKKRLLIVDDDVSLTKMLRTYIEGTGEYEVKVLNHPMHAIREAREFRPDIILLDVMMPHMDGGDVEARLKQDPFLKDVPVLMMTALISNDEISDDSVVECGSLLMLPKPINFGKLMCAMENRMCGAL